MTSSRSDRTTTRQREGNRDHEAEDHHVRLRRRSDAGDRQSGRGPSGRIRARRLTTPLWDKEAGTVLNEVYTRADAFLFGRRTYELFAGSWGIVPDPSINPIAAALHSRPKYVVSTTLANPQWANTTVLSTDVAAAVGKLKASSGGELLVPGSGALIRWLLDKDLVDELNLFIFPVVIGQGTRLFPDAGPDRALELVDSRATPRGVTIQVYRPTGRLQVGTATADLKHVPK